MATREVVKSIVGDIELLMHNVRPIGTNLTIVTVACGGGGVLSKFDGPSVEMQLRGYGGSSLLAAAKTGEPSLTAYFDEINAVLDHLGEKQYVLLGYSHGGYFTTAYALANPDRVAGLILIEPALYNTRDELLHRAELARKGDNESSIETMLQHVQPSTKANQPELARTMMKNVTNKDTLAVEFLLRANHPVKGDSLTHLKMPVLLIGGTKSHVSDTVSQTARNIPHAYVWWVQGAEHLDLMSDAYATQVSDVVNKFTTGLK